MKKLLILSLSFWSSLCLAQAPLALSTSLENVTAIAQPWSDKETTDKLFKPHADLVLKTLRPVSITITNNSDKVIQLPLNCLTGLNGKIIDKSNVLKVLPKLPYTSNKMIGLTIWALPIALLTIYGLADLQDRFNGGTGLYFDNSIRHTFWNLVQPHKYENQMDEIYAWSQNHQTVFENNAWTNAPQPHPHLNLSNHANFSFPIAVLASATALACATNWLFKRISLPHQTVANSTKIVNGKKETTINKLNPYYTIKPGEIFKDLVFVAKDADLSQMGINL